MESTYKPEHFLLLGFISLRSSAMYLCWNSLGIFISGICAWRKKSWKTWDSNTLRIQMPRRTRVKTNSVLQGSEPHLVLEEARR